MLILSLEIMAFFIKIEAKKDEETSGEFFYPIL